MTFSILKKFFRAKETKIISSPDPNAANEILLNLMEQASQAALQKNFRDANECYQTAIALEPENLMPYLKFSECLLKQNNLDSAITICEHALKIDPNSTEAQLLLADYYFIKHDENKVITILKNIIAIDPINAAAYLKLGRIFSLIAELEQSEEYLKKGLSFNEKDPVLLNLLGFVLTNANRFDEAFQYLKALTDHYDNFPSAHLNLSLLHLKQGDYINGFKGYESRHVFNEDKYPAALKKAPVWKGENISPKTLLVIAEQGFGDILQFGRYAQLLKKYHLNIIFYVPLELKSLFSCYESFLKITTTIPNSFDYYIFLMDLPHIFGSTLETIPQEIPYISADMKLIETWKEKLSAEKKFKVGLVWSGDRYPNGLENYYISRRRNIAFDELAPLAQIPNVQFYSLQKGEASQEYRNSKVNLNIIDYSEHFKDFADTAAFIENLDLVISVDTSVVHLAGALGKPVWVLNRFDSCWRWLSNRSDSPWYPTLRLFNQTQVNDWKSVILNIAEALKKTANTKQEMPA